MSLQRHYFISTDLVTTPTEPVYSVTEYVSLLNVKLKPLQATIQGEIGKIKYSPKALYFSLYDKDRTVLNCLVWLSRLHSLGIELKDGVEVKIQGYPDVYPQNGLLTFKANFITPIGEGALRVAFEKLKGDLEKQGYFRQDRKQVLPSHIQRMGLITSATGVVIQDFLTGVGNHGLRVHFYDVRVEGLNAIEQIVTAIQWFNQHTQDIQVLVIARGGGSLESLQPFNSFEVAKAIFGSKIPVMTAIGHELDVTIADLVADVRASVPMDAGQRISASWRKAADRLETIERNIISSFKNTSRQLDEKLTLYSDNFISCYAKFLSQCRQDVDVSQHTLLRCFRDLLRKVQRIEDNFNHNYERFARRLTNNRIIINSLERTLVREASHFFHSLDNLMTDFTEQFLNSGTRFTRYLQSLQGDIANSDMQIERQANRWYVAMKKKVFDCEKMLVVCDPQLKLKQGFSIARDKTGKVLHSSKTVRVHDIIHVELSDGILESEVEDIR